MKRADLTVGTEYLAARSNNWQSQTWSNDRVTVESSDKVATVAGYSRGTAHRFTDSQGEQQTVYVGYGNANAVIVSYMARGYGENAEPHKEFKAVPVAQIRALWAEGEATVKANREAQARARAAKANRDADYRFRMETVNNRLVDLEVGGYGPDRKPYLYTNEHGEVKVPMALLEALLNEIDPEEPSGLADALDQYQAGRDTDKD